MEPQIANVQDLEKGEKVGSNTVVLRGIDDGGADGTVHRYVVNRATSAEHGLTDFGTSATSSPGTFRW